jgi:hypothetical protein
VGYKKLERFEIFKSPFLIFKNDVERLNNNKISSKNNNKIFNI